MTAGPAETTPSDLDCFTPTFENHAMSPSSPLRVGGILLQVLPPGLLMLAYYSLITWCSMRGLIHGITFQPIGALGTALAIFLAFRNQASYDRWWEARKLWGTLVNESRSWARQISSLLTPPPSELRTLTFRQIAFAHSMRIHLRKDDEWDDIRPLLEAEEFKAFEISTLKPWWLLNRQASAVRALGPDPIILATLDRTLSAFTDVLGACERIKKTPLPREYDVFTRFFVYVYGCVFPLGLIEEFGLAVVPSSLGVWMLFAVLERIGYNLEDPFEGNIFDIPLDALCTTIERDLRSVVD